MQKFKNNQSIWIEKIFSQNIQTEKSDQRFQKTFWSYLEYSWSGLPSEFKSNKSLAC